jgi:hypothetical protein
MLSSLLAPISLVVASLSITPDTVPARGEQEAVLTLDHAAMVRLTARGSAGTACTVVDHVRGPFVTSGIPGRAACDTDLLLDAGTYKLRLSSPAQGKGSAALSATPFPEVNAPLGRLELGREREQTLKTGQQASWWVRVDARQEVRIRVAGRTVGAMALWRNGEWVEEGGTRATTVSLRPGQPIHEWWVERVLEPGDYLLTAYGTLAHRWTTPEETDTVTVAWGFPSFPPERGLSTRLPPSGLLAYQVPAKSVVAHAAVTGATAGPVQVMVFGPWSTGMGQPGDARGTCRVEPKALVPECAAAGGGATDVSVVMVRGVPGTPVDLRWAPWGGSGPYADGQYRPVTDTLPFTATGTYLVAVHDVPADRDGPPLACVLERKSRQDTRTVATDLPKVSPDAPLDRTFNYDASTGVTLWFQVTEWSVYSVLTRGETKAHCELYKVDGERQERLTHSEPNATRCDVSKLLDAGVYALKLTGGHDDVEDIRIGKALALARRPSATKSSCLFPSVVLEGGPTTHHQVTLNRRGSAAARGLHLRPLPLTLTEALPLELEPGAQTKLAVAPGAAIVVRSVGGLPFSCALQSGARSEAREGECALPPTTAPDTLLLSNPTGDPVSVSVVRPTLLRPQAALAPYLPTIQPLPVVALDTPTSLDFARGQSHSLLFEVRDAGLYHVTTEGLLATRCQVRTPLVATLADATGGGRGRNCLVAQYLRPGRYLLTVGTTGESRGRGAVVLRRRPLRGMAPVTADGEVFFRVPAGELVQQELTVRKPARHLLSTAAQAASLTCRLDDPDGWPVVPVPTPCDQAQDLRAGRYLWTQLPLTVDSMRRTELKRVRDPVVLKGNKPHTLQLNTWYTAKLGRDGKDEFFFDLGADADVDVVLTTLVQGRLYAMPDAKTLKLVEVIAPRGDTEPPPQEPEGDDPSMFQEGGDEDHESQGDEVERPLRGVTGPPAPRVDLPHGQVVRLAAGRHKLVTEHSRADAHATYRLHLGVEVFIPGVSRDVAVPGRAVVRMPGEGVLRLRTQGSADVRCRVLDGRGNLVAESRDNGDDWNCSLAEPLAAGDYALVLESESQQPGFTRVSTTFPKLEEVGVLGDVTVWKVASNVVVGTLPAPPVEAVQEVVVKAATPFSCAVETGAGVNLHRCANATSCQVLLLPSGQPYRVRAWTLDRPAQVTLTTASKPVSPGDGVLTAGGALQVTIPRPGRYKTAEGVSCLPGGQGGALRPCGPEASLEAGPHVFASPGARGDVRLALAEVTVSLATPLAEHVQLTRQPAIQRQVTPAAALHLLSVRVPAGQDTPPTCLVEGGVRDLSDDTCHAASGLVTESTSRWWALLDQPAGAEVLRASVMPPAQAVPLAPGRQPLSLATPLRLAMPNHPFSLTLLLPSDAWAVQVDPGGGALHLCGPAPGTRVCTLGGQGGEVVVSSVLGGPADATLLLVAEAPRPPDLSGVFEWRAVQPDVLKLKLPGGESRRVVVEGPATCVVRLDDGSRLLGCEVQVPAKLGGVLEVAHGVGFLRAFTHGPGGEHVGRMGPVTAASPPLLPAAQAVVLSGAVVDRTIQLPAEAAVQVQAEEGVCALVSGVQTLASSGLGGGCVLHRVLGPGTYRMVVRRFAGVPLWGSASWTAEPVASLGEGVGDEQWLAPGQARVFRFQAASAGRVGVGLQVEAETLDCAVHDESNQLLGTGCHQFLPVGVGSYRLTVRAPPGTGPARFRPVVLGLQGAQMGVPDAYLRDLFQRVAAP